MLLSLGIDIPELDRCRKKRRLLISDFEISPQNTQSRQRRLISGFGVIKYAFGMLAVKGLGKIQSAINISLFLFI